MEEKTKPQARTRDLGKGSIPKLLAQLAIPVVVAQIVNLLYNIVDRIYIGHIPAKNPEIRKAYAAAAMKKESQQKKELEQLLKLLK